MNFETMNKQRKLVLIAAACGIICMFLPWASIDYGYGYGKTSNNGMSGWGVVVFICFLVAGALAYSGDQTKHINRVNWMLVVIAGGIATLIMLISFFKSTDLLKYVQFGFYGAFSASIAVLLFAYNNRAANDSLANGFDALKEAIGSKASATPNSNNRQNP